MYVRVCVCVCVCTYVLCLLTVSNVYVLRSLSVFKSHTYQTGHRLRGTLKEPKWKKYNGYNNAFITYIHVSFYDFTFLSLVRIQ